MKRVACRLLLLLFLLSGASIADAAPTADQRRDVNRLSVAVKKAVNLYGQEKYREALAAVVGVQGEYERLVGGGNAEVVKLLRPIYTRLLNAHALLELEGYVLPDLKRPDGSSANSPQGAPGSSGPVGFVKDVAPILVGKCGRCHVSANRGMFSMVNYETLMRGVSAGVVVMKGDAAGSRIIELIEEGDMPRGGGKISPEELSVLKRWIDADAKFDGPDPRANLATLAPQATGDDQQMAIAMATGKETVSFARDIAPVFVKTCTGCHGGNQPANRLGLLTIRSLFNGGDSGPALEPGKPASSLLISKLKGAAEGEQMPRRLPPLDAKTIALFEKWIEEGAKYDGQDPDRSVGQVAALYRAEHATHEELSLDRAKLATSNWKLGLPDEATPEVQTKNFHLRGNVGQGRLEEIGQQAEQVAPKVAEIFGASANAPLVKGKMALFVFKQRYDYSEFGQMVERRQVPNSWRGHWKFSIIDAYGAIVPPKADEFSLDALLAQQMAGVYVAQRGESPRWLREGAARLAASRLAPDDSRVAAWNQAVKSIASGMSKPDDFMTGRLSPEDSDIASYSFVKFLMSDKRRFATLLDALKRPGPFAQKFAGAYGSAPVNVAAGWAARTVAGK